MSAAPVTGMLSVGVMTSQSGLAMTEALTGADGLTVQRIEHPRDLSGFIDRLDVLFVSNDFYHESVARQVRTAARLRYLHFVSSGVDICACTVRRRTWPSRAAVPATRRPWPSTR